MTPSIEQLHTAQRAVRNLQNNEHHCPCCASEDIAGGNVTVEDGFAVQDMACNRCEATWRETYQRINLHRIADGSDRELVTVASVQDRSPTVIINTDVVDLAAAFAAHLDEHRGWAGPQTWYEVARRIDPAVTSGTADEPRPDIVAAIRTWWINQIEGDGQDWDNYGEWHIERVEAGYRRQLDIDRDAKRR